MNINTNYSMLNFCAKIKLNPADVKKITKHAVATTGVASVCTAFMPSVQDVESCRTYHDFLNTNSSADNSTTSAPLMTTVPSTHLFTGATISTNVEKITDILLPD